MPKRIVPFTEAYHYMNGERQDLKMIQEAVPFYRSYWNVDGEPIPNENVAEVGQEFIKRFGTIERKGIFRDIREVFEAELKIGDQADYQKNSVFLIDEKNNTNYVMYPVEFLDMVRRATVKDGIVKGIFSFVSKGQAISLIFLE